MKPDVIFKLERGEAPWIEDGEVPSSDSPGECIRIRQMGDGTSTVSAGYWGGSLKCAVECSFQIL